ncbi:MAG: 2-(1,2-epoxy-1,2-dihydrophenyl)acetyl-CoA isomerase [Ignavibacteria bacterium]|jgi:2-(1,2-epoxy-1,2-dihydrophenyl)acetyl-CoA isomerase|nr:2-(1,2-epoxy-1,2-dihydrophenyl)acetyl-CoA isomerase [Ignavibacteria bacterium]MCU7503284.1 2-(1,2-epoxy-1,2-dihydrophenyl)acetyl-CoA isomerase [Ignavibacteria bacterium]MCU7515770.1 2-(1,2-epoxy-1,2-dihydrophenyl)acetyl-CoA isomerase [Ignavibacteria bacterium]
MEYKFLKFKIEDSIKLLTLNRPEVLNSFNREMAYELFKALELAKDNDKVRAVLITGEGRAFSAGQDLKEISDGAGKLVDPGIIVKEVYNPLIKMIRCIEKPVVCAVNGTAAGAGANIAIACDFVVASSSASFIQSFINVGLLPDSGGTFFLPRFIGLQRASSIMMLGEKISSYEALDMGLIYKVVEPEVLLKEATAIAKKLASMPTKSLGFIKRALNRSFNNDLDSQLELEAKFQQLAGMTEDYNEGIQAFLEKRAARFSGK